MKNKTRVLKFGYQTNKLAVLMIGVIAILSAAFVSADYEGFYNLYMNPQLSVAYGLTPKYSYVYSPTYDASTNYQRGWFGNYNMDGMYPAQGMANYNTYGANYNYNQANYNPYGATSDYGLYGAYGTQTYPQTRDYTNEGLTLIEQGYDNSYVEAARDFAYLNFFQNYDPRQTYGLLAPWLYPYGKKPYFKTYGTNPAGQGYLTEGLNPFWGFMYERNFHCHGPNFGCHTHNVFPDSA